MLRTGRQTHPTPAGPAGPAGRARGVALAMALVVHPVAAEDFNPANADIAQLRAALDAGRVSSEDLVRYYRQRIDMFDKRGPCINALITLDATAIARARTLDAEGKRMAHKPMLYGVPFIAKDNYDTSGLPTTGGSAALKHSVPSANAFVIQKLLDQGAILIGKANMSELAASYGRLGYSSAGGLTVNPYNTARDVSGSSSGSAAAVAAGFAAFALGTDTAGSVRAPASTAGLVGLRPTLGTASRNGVIPLSLTFDTPGILTHTVKDLAVVLQALAGPDPGDAATLQRPTAPPNYAESLDIRSIGGARLGVLGNFRGANAEVDEVEQAALQRLKAQGAVLVPITLPREFETLWMSVLGPVGQAEFKPQFERYLRSLPPGQPRTLREVIRVSESRAVMYSRTPVNPARLDALRDADTTQTTDSPRYISILTGVIPALRRQLRAVLTANDLQALVFSTMDCPATPRFDRADPSYVCASEDSYRASYLASAAGFPEITVPAGRISANMPVGYSFLGLPFGEAQLLALADAFQVTGPSFAPPVLQGPGVCASSSSGYCCDPGPEGHDQDR